VIEKYTVTSKQEAFDLIDGISREHLSDGKVEDVRSFFARYCHDKNFYPEVKDYLESTLATER